MRYALLLHNLEAEEAGISDADMEPMRAAFGEYARMLTEADVLVAGDILQPAALTTTVTLRTGELQVQDGPFADTREKLAGVFLIDVPDLDAALVWAEKCPGAQYGSVEVRPVGISIENGLWRELV
jgi:hypothetical protein